MKQFLPPRFLCLIGLLAGLMSQAAFAQRPENLEPPPNDPNAPVRKQASTEEAIRIYQKFLEKSPENIFTRTRLGLAYLRLARETDDEENYLHAEAELKKVLKTYPKSPEARVYLAMSYMAQHKFHEALKLSQEVYREDPKNAVALATLADAQLELGQYEQAEKSYQELKQKAPADHPELLARLARMAEVRGRTAETLELLHQGLKEEQTARPESSEIAWYHLRLGEVYFNSNQLDKADQHFQASLDRREKYVPALLGLGQVRAGQGRYKEAAALFEEVVAQKPDFDLIGDLGTLYSLAGNQTKAKQLEEKAISLVPEAAKIETEARHLALFLADREIQLDLALESARKEMKVREDVFAYDVLAWTLFKSGQTEAAWDAMQNALKHGTQDARMHFHAGMIARGLGRSQLAQEHLSKALKINPHFGFTEPEEARKVLAELKAP